ncbi:MAG TPA: hypothetical protein VLB29_14645 [Nocardioidaceae bacterium]|nr:hypothetical protein [Nocardioidaceae bacterium]
MPPRAPRRVGVAAVAIVVAPLALSACASYPGADYARTACGDLASLMKLTSPSHAEVELHAGRAAAWSSRAARLDGAFEDLSLDLREVLEAVTSETSTNPPARRRLDKVLSDVASACEGLEAPVATGGGTRSGLTWRALTGS